MSGEGQGKAKSELSLVKTKNWLLMTGGEGQANRQTGGQTDGRTDI